MGLSGPVLECAAGRRLTIALALRPCHPRIIGSWSRSGSASILMSMDRAQLADFLRRRREALQPTDVGLAQGVRRRTLGLRREEVAALSSMSTDYYSRLEQQRGPQPSEQMVEAIARGLRLTLDERDERDHLFRIAGHNAPSRVLRSDHVSPALMRVLDRLDDTPAQVMSDLGGTLVQNRLAVALLGAQTHFRGPTRSAVYRWFNDPAERLIYPPEDRDRNSRTLVADLRASMTRSGRDSQAAALVDRLLHESTEFTDIWQLHEVAIKRRARKRLVHPELGLIELECQLLFTETLSQALLVFTATPGTEDHEKLELLSVIGSQELKPDWARP